jgi:guanylate kinase
MNKTRLAVVISAPSGAGKSTLARWLLERFPQLELSVSATSRAPRNTEQEGREYYFVSNELFEEKIKQYAFVEWEEVYRGTYYGTLRSELERIWNSGHSILFDVDVKGGIRLKHIFGEKALSIFIQPPSLKVLRERLKKRDTDSPQSIQKRLNKAAEEISYASYFDRIIVNNFLDDSKLQIEQEVRDFIGN